MEYHLCSCKHHMHHSMNIIYNCHILQNASCLAGNYEVIAYEGEKVIANGTAIVNEGILNGTIQTGQLPKRRWNLSIRVQNNNHFIETSEPIVFSEFYIYI